MGRIFKRRVLPAALAAVVVFGWLRVKPASADIPPAAPWRRPTFIAHRGSPGHAENTVAAILGASALGADWIEIDVRETRDGAFVLHHDAELKDSLGLPKTVGQATLAEIQRNPIRGSRDYVPTFAQAVDALARDRAELYVHLKDGVLDPGAARELVATCRARGFLGRVRFNSGSFLTLARLRAQDPGVWLEYDLYDAKGLLRSNDLTTDDLRAIRSLAVRSVGTFSFKTTGALVSQAHRSGLLVDALVSAQGLPFHDEKAAYKDMIALGVDEIMTDDVGLYPAAAIRF